MRDIELEGERIKLIPASYEHVEELFNVSGNHELWRYSPSSISTIEDMHNTMDSWMRLKEQGVRYPFVIMDKATNEIVGSTSYLDISLSNRKLEIGGTWLDPKVQRTRVNTECKYLLLKYGFESLQLLRIQFKTDAKNEKSNLAIQRIGAQYEGTIRQDMILHNGHIRDTNIYSILNSEWNVVRDKLTEYLNIKYM
ncbi:RimJ/RimL family protein N-acetyltransferase [Paenibacillus cellulosilyticus]|uniref:RimJ/RimL family protein N-acetyltransferase n=1 Tax=Paenibacillus cellulosilyticus TaxID=375489 RepID=A0A2V2YLF5_9BACL|nr:GNAT family protein [Paenibacillus cellulosilyticus]PWV94455.1 RimJ/RimL family protein N-acetyltransferase [Paenibacillus cellulosilyticus]QKS44974.1 GNAT family N-acetyltransferase [Paenibacillus cellulosilyticus]